MRERVKIHLFSWSFFFFFFPQSNTNQIYMHSWKANERKAEEMEAENPGQCLLQPPIVNVTVCFSEHVNKGQRQVTAAATRPWTSHCMHGVFVCVCVWLCVHRQLHRVQPWQTQNDWSCIIPAAKTSNSADAKLTSSRLSPTGTGLTSVLIIYSSKHCSSCTPELLS